MLVSALLIAAWLAMGLVMLAVLRTMAELDQHIRDFKRHMESLPVNDKASSADTVKAAEAKMSASCPLPVRIGGTQATLSAEATSSTGDHCPAWRDVLARPSTARDQGEFREALLQFAMELRPDIKPCRRPTSADIEALGFRQLVGNSFELGQLEAMTAFFRTVGVPNFACKLIERIPLCVEYEKLDGTAIVMVIKSGTFTWKRLVVDYAGTEDTFFSILGYTVYRCMYPLEDHACGAIQIDVVWTSKKSFKRGMPDYISCVVISNEGVAPGDQITQSTASCAMLAAPFRAADLQKPLSTFAVTLTREETKGKSVPAAQDARRRLAAGVVSLAPTAA